MLNIGGGEIALILIVALLLLGPKRMPELARGLGKFLREFRRQTDDVRTMVEREFYKMDQDVQPLATPGAPAKAISPNTADMAVPRPAPGTLAAAAAANGTPIPNGPAAAASTAVPGAAPDASAAPPRPLEPADPARAPGDSPSPEKAG